MEGGGLVELGGNLTDELVGTNPLADGDFKPLGDGLADGLGNLLRWFLVIGVNGG